MAASIGHLDADTAGWYRDLRQETQDRLRRTELVNDDMARMLLQVFELHLRREGRQAVTDGGEVRDDLRGALDTVELAIASDDFDTAEDALLAALSEVRRCKAGGEAA